MRKLGAAARALLDGDRRWSFAAALANRVSGFVASFVLTRVSGPAVYGAYAALVNTAATVTNPVLPGLSHASTLQGRSLAGARSPVIAAYAVISLLLGLVGCGAFVIVCTTSDVAGTLGVLAWAAGSSVVIAQVFATAMQGVLYGAGEFRSVALRYIAVAALGVPASIAAVIASGLSGALAVLVGTSIVLPVLLLLLGLARTHVARHELADSIHTAWQQLTRSAPNVAATSITAVISWVTTIYLVHLHYGSAGIGVVAIGMQWQTLGVLAVTSWSGITMRTLVIARDDSPDAFRHAVRSLVVKNAAATMACGLGLAVVAGELARLYHAQSTELALVLRVNACTTVVLAINNVTERALYCTHRQREWLVASACGDVTNLTLSLAFLSRDLVVAPLAALASAVVTTLISFGMLRQRP